MISNELKINISTLVDCASFAREVVISFKKPVKFWNYCQMLDTMIDKSEKLGGPGEVVEIDENIPRRGLVSIIHV